MNQTTLRRLLAIAAPERKNLLWGLFFLIISSLSGLAYPQMIRWLIDRVLQPGRMDLLLPVVLGLFVAFLLQGISSAFRYYLFTLSGERIVVQLRKKLFSKILEQDVSFFDFNRTGELMSRLSSDCTTLQNTVSVNISMGLRNLGQTLGGLGFMFYTSWKLSLIMLILIPPVGIAAALFGKRIKKYSKLFQESLADASMVAEESISGLRTVKSFVQETRESTRYDFSLTEALNTARLRILAIAQFLGLGMIIGFAAVCFVLWFGGREVLLKELSVGDLSQFLLYLMLVAIGVGSLGSLWGDFMSGIGASTRVFQILELKPNINDDGKVLTTLNARIEFKDVNFYYPTRIDISVLNGLSFKMNAGETIALVGSSGSGKTTIASLIPRFYEPTSGQIFIDDVLLSDLKPSWLRQRIGVVSQEPILISSTIIENIKYGKPEASEAEVIEAAKAANAWEFIQNFPEGLYTKVGEKGLQLSGGQKQRVAIARALLKDPKILILDEATSNLDTASEHLVQEALQRLMQGGRSTLIIAHRLNTVKSADRILVLKNGKIIQEGKHDVLAKITDGFYYQLLQRQFNEDLSS
jgi:ABC-type multidrug transport system fused ATPase/permease subunit